jgi:hypothetical protein
VVIDSNLTVNGTLIVHGFNFVASTDDTKEVIVNGYLMAENNSPATKDKWFTPVGVSYIQTMDNSKGNETEYFIITSLSNIQYAIDASDDKEVTIEGKAKIGNISISGGEGEMAEVTFAKEVNAGTITIDNVKLIFTDGKKINATIADSQGSIVLRGAYADDGLEIFSEGNGVYMTGEVTDTDDASYSIYFYGKTGMEDATITWGKYVPESGNEVYPTIVFAGDTLATGKKDQIKAIDEDRYGHDIVTITGALTADGSARLIIYADVEVLGSFIASEKTYVSTAGTIDLYGNLFLGTTMAAIYNADEVVSAGGWDNAPAAFGLHGTDDTAAATAAAVASGKINVGGYLVAIAGSSLDEGIVEDFDYFDIFVDGSLWLTIYKGDDITTSEFYLEGLKAPVMNAKVSKIVNQDDVEVATYDDTYNVVEKSKKAIVFGTDDAVFFNVKYDVFTIKMKTDASIKSVYLDGILMKVSQNANTFELPNQLAGKHTVTVEPATGYIAKNAYLYDDHGVSLPGLTFNFDREDCVQNADGSYGFTIYYNIAGTELTPSEVVIENDWNITTILLLVLVILIAVMAVIVAMRLNRN